MQIEGTHVLSASREAIWALLLNPETLARVTPGITRLEPIGEHSYKAISEVKIGPVDGSFAGNMEVEDQVPPESFVLKMRQNSKIGNVTAKGNIFLKAIDPSTTEVEFSGKAQLSGLLARTGQRVLSGVARTLTDQFFKALEKELETTS
ncbi:MAG: carbon monoxide dehydrogenase subunit G [Bacteroidota bacterium]